jgi:hypothetical protein
VHRVRIVNPSRDNGSTLGTEVWLDGRKLDGVTGLAFEARLDSVYSLTLSLNVELAEIAGTMRVGLAAVEDLPVIPQPQGVA